MIIRKVIAHAFGPLHGETLELAHGMTVIIGDNESGKSSWHAAIYAGLCGRRRGKGQPRKAEQRFAGLHKPWDGGDWSVTAEVALDDGRRIELHHDLDGKVNCHARDLDLGTDVSAELMHDGAPDGALLLGLDRSTFPATACIEQGQMLRVLDDADGLQTQMQQAAATAGDDSTAASALQLIDGFKTGHVGSERANSTKPLRSAMDAVTRCKEDLEAAQRAHAGYLQLAGQAEDKELAARAAEALVRAHDAAAARHRAEHTAHQVDRAGELNEALGHAAPTPAAEDEAAAQAAAEALTLWRNRPPEPALTGATAAAIQEEIDALPPRPAGDTEVHTTVSDADAGLQSARGRLAQLEADRPCVPEIPALLTGVTDRDLEDLARALDAREAAIDPGLEAEAQAAAGGLAAARTRNRTATVLFALAAAAAIGAGFLLTARNPGAFTGALILAVVLAVLGVTRHRGASLADAQARNADAQASLNVARQQAAETRRHREAATQRCRDLGLDPDPDVVRQAAADKASTSARQADLASWERKRTGLQAEVAVAETGLRVALSARGHPAPASPAPGNLADALTQYREACRDRAMQAREADRQDALENRRNARRVQEQQADEDRGKRAAAEKLVMQAGAACGLPEGPADDVAADLEKWLKRRSDALSAADTARKQAAELEALLDGRTLDQLAEEADRARRRADDLAEGVDPALLAAADPATADDKLPQLRQEAKIASESSASASGELGQYAASMPSVPEAEEAVAAAEHELSRVTKLEQTLSLTRQFLENAQDRVHRDIAPVLAGTVRKWLPVITDGRYTDVIVDPVTLQVSVCGESRPWQPAELLSYGTREQIYLLLRIALADHLTQGHDTCPLILDDVTVHADTQRTSAVLELLLQIAGDRQVILFTQEDQVAAWAREHLNGPEHAIRALQPVPAGS